MASKLNVTVAYLSAVENGNREVPDSWIDILSKAYDLTIDEKRQIQSYAYEKKDLVLLHAYNTTYWIASQQVVDFFFFLFNA